MVVSSSIFLSLATFNASLSDIPRVLSRLPIEDSKSSGENSWVGILSAAFSPHTVFIAALRGTPTLVSRSWVEVFSSVVVSLADPITTSDEISAGVLGCSGVASEASDKESGVGSCREVPGSLFWVVVMVGEEDVAIGELDFEGMDFGEVDFEGTGLIMVICGLFCLTAGLSI